jgi:hypothetical protein
MIVAKYGTAPDGSSNDAMTWKKELNWYEYSALSTIHTR